MLELMLKARDLGYPADYLVRSQHNRVLPGGAKLWDQVMAQTPIGRIRFMLPAGRGRKSRWWGFAVRNTGEALELQDLRVVPLINSRRV